MKIKVDYSEKPYIPRMVMLGAFVGIVGGLGAVGFHYLILAIKNVFFGATSTSTFLETVVALPWYHRLLAPVAGGLIIGPVITYFVKEARGHGVPEVMEALALRGGVIRFRVAPLKAMMSAICIGSGGSAGREGPIVQIGAAFGSALGKYLNMPKEKIETLLGAGAAAGVAGTFNAPMAGVIFSLEVLLKKVKMESFSPIVVAAVVGTAVANTFFDRAGPIFDIPVHEMVSYWELLIYMGLGLCGALTALLYSNSLYSMEAIFERIPVPEALKAALGGLFIGLLALMIPHIHSTGYPVMESALHSRFPLRIVFFLIFAKILATSFTLGSGGSGGIFAPGLFIGAMLGSSYGILVHTLLPGLTAGPSSYAMVGMGAVFAGATHAPLTAIIILFEMTGDPEIILPMMFTCVVSSVVASVLQKRNIYTTKLLKRGIDLNAIARKTILETLRAEDGMITDIIKLTQRHTMQEAKEIFRGTAYNYLPVISGKTGKYLGMITYQDIMAVPDSIEDRQCLVGDLKPSFRVAVYKDDSLKKALKIIERNNISMVPVLDEDHSKKLMGILRRRDIFESCHQNML